jgi:uncharacterized protein
MMGVSLLLRIVVGIAVCLYLGVCVFLYFNQARFLFPGAFMPYPAGLAGLASRLGLEEITIAVDDGTALFALQRPPDDGKPVVILFHGNASFPGAYGFLYGDWIGAGYGIIAPAARGYPRSGGEADGEKMLADALAIYDWVAKAFPDHPIYVLGQSMGSAPAVHLAAHRPVAGAVLISPFKSMLSLVAGKFPYLPVSWLLRSPFRSDLDMPRITAPVLILHGEDDTLVPVASARELAALARTKVEFEVIQGASHGDGMFASDMVERIDRFLGINMP